MSQLPIQRRAGLGIFLALSGGLLISIDIPVIHLAQINPWVFMFLRGCGLAAVLGLALLYARKWTDTPENAFADRDWVEIGILYGMSSILFTISVFNTSTANLVFILAFNPIMAAFFTWYFIGERPTLSTWIAILATMSGVGIIVHEGLQGGTVLGDLSALAAATLLSLTLTRTRMSGKDMSLSGCLGGMITALFALPLAIIHFEMPGAIGWMFLNVLVLVPLSGFAFALAPRYIPAPQVALFFLLETVLAPIWVWLLFAETPSHNTMIGGGIVLAAICGHTFIQLMQASKKNYPPRATANMPTTNTTMPIPPTNANNHLAS